MRRLLYRLTNRLPCRIISDDGQPYLERYHVCSLGKIRVYLHRFVGSDPDRGLHSHPWSWAMSLVLSGWYFEERFSGTDKPVLRRVKWLNILLGESFHRVVMPAADAECWTLFIHRQADTGRRWGFLRPFPRVEGEGAGRVFAERLVFTPYTYPGGGTSSGEWWKLVPKGRDEPRRRPVS